MKVHVVDGTYELFRAYYGAPKSTNDAGHEVGATRALLRSLASLLSEPDVTHVGVAFDHVIESFRNELFDGYKTGEGIEAPLRSQFELAERAASGLGLTVWPMVEFEADDALATMAAHATADSRVQQVVICSPDKDLAQCVVADRVVCRDRMRGKVIDEAGVQAKFGIYPRSIPDYLALVGDTADGIPGVPKWGAKSTATLLAHYRHWENIPTDESEWGVKVRGAAGLAANLREHRAVLPLYKQLATLRTDVPLDEDVDALEWLGPLRAELEELCDFIGERDVLSRV